jgi:polysaccharide pyruvyl transferase WcaK-like protein
MTTSVCDRSQRVPAISEGMSRRALLAAAGGAAVAATSHRALADFDRPPRILLRSSWATVNIGDIAHTPGVLRLLEAHLPQAEVWLWPSKVDNGVEDLLLDRFPSLKIVDGSRDLAAAFAECDFLLHGSGANFVAQSSVMQWLSSEKSKGKPFGVYGITLGPKQSWKTQPDPPEVTAAAVEVLNRAAFVYFRDSESLRFARAEGLTVPVAAYGPDGAFACDLGNPAKAEMFLREHRLDPGKFLCVIPRARYTPSWRMPGKEGTLDPVKAARNDAMLEHDHAPLREAIVRVVRETDCKVLVCPEDMTQMQIGKDVLYDPLPSDVKERVVWRADYWLTDEALSVYRQSAGLFGNELHSAIMCIGNGIPAVVCRWAEQTSKGTMWRDIGLDSWLFDLDDERQCAGVAEAVPEIAKHPRAAVEKARGAQMRVEALQAESMAVLRKLL